MPISSAALIRDGKLIAATEEERFRRTKHWAGFPSQAIAYCLKEASIGLSDVDHIAFNQDSRANLFRKVRYFLMKRPNMNLVLGAAPRARQDRAAHRGSQDVFRASSGGSRAAPIRPRSFAMDCGTGMA